jgi:hypothetical protein
MKLQIAVLAAIAVTLGSALSAFAQDTQVRERAAALATSATLAGFHVTVARTNNGVTLPCKTGCAWKALTFALPGKPTTVNANGIAGKDNPEKEGMFLLRVGVDDWGFQLTCDRGGAWRKLGWVYPPNGKAVTINEYGTAQLHSGG